MTKFRNKSKYLIIIVYLFLFFIMWCSPYSRDDYDFLSLHFNNIFDFFHFVLQYGNGRLLGNISGILLIRYPLLSYSIRAFILTSIIFLTPCICGYKSTSAYVLSFILFTLIDPIIFGEVYLWSSGFYNYVPPIFITILSLYLITNFSSSNKNKLLICSTILILGVCGQLYIEHSTITNLFISTSLTIFSIVYKKKDMISTCACWLLGTIIGAAIMFFIPSFFYVEGNPAEVYRSYNLQSLFSIVLSCAKNTLRIGNYFSGMNSISLCLGTICTIYLTRNRMTRKSHQIIFKLSAVFSCILIINSIGSTNIWGGELALLHHITTSIIVLILVCLWFFSSLKITLSHVRNAVSFFIICSIISLAPLLVVSPIPERTAFQALFWMNISALICILELLKTVDFKFFSVYKQLLGTISIAIIFVLVSTFISVKFMVNTREQYILSELEKDSPEIVVFKIPYEYTSLDSVWSYDLYYFREKQRDTVFQTVDYTQWMNDFFPGL